MFNRLTACCTKLGFGVRRSEGVGGIRLISASESIRKRSLLLRSMMNRMRLVGREPGSAAAIIVWLGGFFLKFTGRLALAGCSSEVGVVEACVVGGLLVTASGTRRSSVFPPSGALPATSTTHLSFFAFVYIDLPSIESWEEQ